MNQTEVIHAIAVNSGLPRKAVGEVLGHLYQLAARELGTEGGEIALPGLGKLKATTRAAREGRNPATGEAVQIPARNAVKFSASKALKDAIA